MHRISWGPAAVLLGLVWPSLCSAQATVQSMWQKRDPAKVFLFYDTGARGIGDVITVEIQENTGVKNQDSRQLGKDAQTSAHFDFDTSTSGDIGAGSAAASTDSNLTSNRKFNGSAKFSSDRAFKDRVTVTVIDIQPNGNLVVAGTRQLGVAGDSRTLLISGIVRPYDVRPDNSVQSQYIANFKMSYEGTGVERVFTNQGWLSRIGNKLWPF